MRRVKPGPVPPPAARDAAPGRGAEEEQEVLAERVAAALGQTPLAVAVSAVNAALMLAVLGGPDDAPEAAAWFAATIGLGAARLLLWWSKGRTPARDPADARRRERLAVAAAVAAGALWGGGAAWLWPGAEAAQLLWVLVVGGMSAGAVALHYAHWPTTLGFVLPAGLPIAARFLAEDTARGEAAGLMVLVFLAALTITARRASAHFAAHLHLRLDLARQAAALAAAQATLRRETELHRATETSLRQAQKMEALGRLTGGIAHDFNNLLMVVLGSLSLLRKRLPPGDARSARLLDNAVEGANRGAVLTQRLLAFGRRQTLRPETLTLARLASGVRDLLRRAIGPAHRLALRFPAELPSVRVDANQLELALLNLAINARDAMPGGGTIEVAARAATLGADDPSGLAAGDYVVLLVTDDGEGMDEATLARATEPFFTTKGVGKGSGLGLPMVLGLAEQSGGRLVLRSRKGEGTTAELWLPCAPPEAEAPPPPPPAPPPEPPPRPLTVLLVDDDPLVLASAAAMLEELGHRVEEADGAATAMARLDRPGGAAPIDLVVTDFGMPGTSGLELAEALARTRPGLPVLIATGYGELPAAEAAGLVRLAKPFGPAELAAAIAAALRRGGCPATPA